jgi:hypothetical protein
MVTKTLTQRSKSSVPETADRQRGFRPTWIQRRLRSKSHSGMFNFDCFGVPESSSLDVLLTPRSVPPEPGRRDLPEAIGFGTVIPA